MTAKLPEMKTYEDYKKQYFSEKIKDQEIIDGKRLAQLSLEKIGHILAKSSK